MRASAWRWRRAIAGTPARPERLAVMGVMGVVAVAAADQRTARHSVAQVPPSAMQRVRASAAPARLRSCERA